MRIILFYDLPVNTAIERKKANDFRKKLIKEGFIMLQESIYCKLVLNKTNLKWLECRLKQIVPSKGSVLMLTVTEKQFSNIKYLSGTKQNDYIDSDNRVIIL